VQSAWNLVVVDTHSVVRGAIANKHRVIHTYNGEVSKTRPHTIGMEDSKQSVLANQFARGSKSGLPRIGQWRYMKVNSVPDATMQQCRRHTGTRHLRPQTCIDDINIEVAHYLMQLADACLICREHR